MLLARLRPGGRPRRQALASSRLTELYLQRNQFDRLRRPPRRSRPTPRTARATSAWPRRTPPRATSARLASSSKASSWPIPAIPRCSSSSRSLAETEGDFAHAAQYQKRLNDFAPVDDGSTRLAASLCGGEFAEAEAVWSHAMEGEQDLHGSSRRSTTCSASASTKRSWRPPAARQGPEQLGAAFPPGVCFVDRGGASRGRPAVPGDPGPPRRRRRGQRDRQGARNSRPGPNTPRPAIRRTAPSR